MNEKINAKIAQELLDNELVLLSEEGMVFEIDIEENSFYQNGEFTSFDDIDETDLIKCEIIDDSFASDDIFEFAKEYKKILKTVQHFNSLFHSKPKTFSLFMVNEELLISEEQMEELTDISFISTYVVKIITFKIKK